MGAGAAWRLEVHASLGSTQDVALDRAREGQADGLAVLALCQTGGRGSHGRAWVAPEGNLNLSVLLRGVSGPPGEWAMLAAVALHEAFASSLPVGALALKWPNDLLLGGGKLAGILVDAAPADGWMVIGIGANLHTAPVLPDRPTAALALHGVDLTPEAAASLVLAALFRWRGVLEAEGFAPVRAAWLRAGPALGAALRVTQGALVLAGRFAGLDAAGALCLETPKGILVLHAGEVAPGAGMAWGA